MQEQVIQRTALLTKKEAGPFIRASQRKVHYLMKNGGLPFVKIGGSTLFLQSDLEEFIASHRIGGTKNGKAKRAIGP
jgi:excisionase family DNA binding protein